MEIGSPHALHFEQIVDSLDAGCHVMTEKPLVCTVAEGEEALRRRDLAGTILMVSYQRHYCAGPPLHPSADPVRRHRPGPAGYRACSTTAGIGSSGDSGGRTRSFRGAGS